MSRPDVTTPPLSPRPVHRSAAASVVIVAATALALGVALKAPVQVGANDISRWCTVWSLLERGTYIIDECPWQSRTQDKVERFDPFATPTEGQVPVKHFYSSKPPFFPTLIAGMLYPARKLSGVPLDEVVPQARLPRFVDKEVDGKTKPVLETPADPVNWPVHVFYFNPIIVLFNILPLWLTLVFYVRLLDRYARDEWSWLICLFTAAFGVLLMPFGQTLNNHTVAAYSAFLALLALVRIYEKDDAPGWLYTASGFTSAFCACNELPAALFGILLFVAVSLRSFRKTLLYFVPAALVPVGFFLATQHLAFGQFRPVYEEFGTSSYKYEGSYWNTPLEMDYFNEHPESRALYLFHMTFGHHGVFSLTPIFLFAVYGALRGLGRRDALRPVAWLTLLLTTGMLAFYCWNPKARNYGGSTQGLRWLFWVIPFWLIMLPVGLRKLDSRKWARGLALAALAVSVFSVGYALRSPWSHPWVLDLMEHLNLYTLAR